MTPWLASQLASLAGEHSGGSWLAAIVAHQLPNLAGTAAGAIRELPAEVCDRLLLQLAAVALIARSDNAPDRYTLAREVPVALPEFTD